MLFQGGAQGCRLFESLTEPNEDRFLGTFVRQQQIKNLIYVFIRTNFKLMWMTSSFHDVRSGISLRRL